MSCITEILKKKGEQDFMVLSGVAVEDGGVYKGYEFLVTLTDRGHRCGYVAIDATHPSYRKDAHWDNAPDVQVHGGITFFDHGTHIINKAIGKHHCDDLWLGFDAMHGGDGKDYETVRKVFADQPESIRSINSIEQLDREFPTIMYEGQHKTKDYMIDECKKLIDQLVEIKAAA